MVLAGILGLGGTGKTGIMTAETISLLNKPENWDAGIQGFANYHIQHPRIKYITVDDFIDLTISKDSQGLCALSEAYLWFLSRMSMSEMNRNITQIIFQSRKKGFDVFWDAQLGSSIDKYLRFMSEFFYLARLPKPRREPQLFRYAYVSPVRFRKFKVKMEYMKPYLDAYDTTEYNQLIRQVERERLERKMSGKQPKEELENEVVIQTPSQTLPEGFEIIDAKKEAILEQDDVNEESLTFGGENN